MLPTTTTPDSRFETLCPQCERAIRRALWNCQVADQEDATQVGLTEVWLKLNDPAMIGNSDSWFIWRATVYARDYATRHVYRYQRRHESTNIGEDSSYEPNHDGGLVRVEENADMTILFDRLQTPVQQHIAQLLIVGLPRTVIAKRLCMSYKAVIWQCKHIALLLAAVCCAWTWTRGGSAWVSVVMGFSFLL